MSEEKHQFNLKLLTAAESAAFIANFDPVKIPFNNYFFSFINLMHFLITEKEALVAMYLWKTFTQAQAYPRPEPWCFGISCTPSPHGPYLQHMQRSSLAQLLFFHLLYKRRVAEILKSIIIRLI